MEIDILYILSVIFIFLAFVMSSVIIFGIKQYLEIRMRLHIVGVIDSLVIFLFFIGILIVYDNYLDKLKVLLIMLFMWISSTRVTNIIIRRCFNKK